MQKFWERGWFQKGQRLIKDVAGLRIGMHAAHTSYFIVLSVFPALLLLLGLLRYTGLEVKNLIDLLKGFLPEALMPSAQRLVINTYRNSTSAVISVSALTALWSAGRGIYGLLAGLNGVYGVQESRGYFYTRAVSVFYTVLFLLVLLLTLILQVFGAKILQVLPLENGIVEGLVDFRFLLLLGVQILLFTAMYVALPNRKGKIAHAFPGAVFAALGWLIFSKLYSVYVELFANLSNIYGSVYAVALSMLWLYCCISIMFYGGVINRYLEEK